MNKLVVGLALLTAFSCSKKTEQTSKPKVIKETIYVEKPVESTPSVGNDFNDETTPTEDEIAPPQQSLPDLSGVHSLTLQWISWDKPGTIKFVPIGKNLYKVTGKQQIGKQYLTIEGEISQVSEKELSFDGTVKHSTTANANGKECVKKGPQTFLSTQNRKYWRMQEMQNCDGIGTDYIDIYF